MIRFDILDISQDGKLLSIKAVIPDMNYYRNVYINEIYIHTQNTYNPADMTSGYIYKYTVIPNQKEVELSLQIDQFNLPTVDNLYIIYATTVGSPASNTPCGMDEGNTVGAIVNFYPVYKVMMEQIKSFNNCCEVPKKFIDLFLNYEAFKLCLYIGDYQEAINKFNRLLRMFRNNHTINRCCHG